MAKHSWELTYLCWSNMLALPVVFLGWGWVRELLRAESVVFCVLSNQVEQPPFEILHAAPSVSFNNRPKAQGVGRRAQCAWRRFPILQPVNLEHKHAAKEAITLTFVHGGPRRIYGISPVFAVGPFHDEDVICGSGAPSSVLSSPRLSVGWGSP